jgi:hypothetical protein
MQRQRSSSIPPPCPKHTRSFGNFSKTPPKIIEQMARQVSAGMPTNLTMRRWPKRPDNWTNQSINSPFQVRKNRIAERSAENIPRQPVLLHFLGAHHVPRMHDYGRVQSFTFLPVSTVPRETRRKTLRGKNLTHFKKGKQGWIAQIPIVHVTADLDSHEIQFIHAPTISATRIPGE